MVNKFQPILNKVYFIEKHSMFHILEGSGGIQVDFKNYHDWQDKIIFLEKGQYIKFLSENFVVRKVEFEDEQIFRNKDVRVLFKHLVSLGYIYFDECASCEQYLSDTIFSKKASDIIDISSRQWYWQNPFHANKEEYHIIFDVKEVIDEQFKNHLSNEALSRLIHGRGYRAQALMKTKVGVSIKSLINQKRLVESKKEIAFTDKSIKEVAYDFGFKDPAYFNRVFTKFENKSPNKFRKEVDFELKDTFLPELYYWLENYHLQERSIHFYAQKMHLSPKTLSKKVKEKLNISLGQLIRHEILNSAKSMLKDAQHINKVAYQLGFEESNHFSSFFKLHTGITPSEYKNKKYNH